MGRPPQQVSELLNGKRRLTPETALQLEAALGVTAQFWLNREAQYRLALLSRVVDNSAIVERSAQAQATR
jgi:HTH-type transcriptional regulator/antitoxin HigA